MDPNFLNLFDEKMMQVGAKAANTEEAIKLLGAMMAQEGFVEAAYWEDVLKREETFPDRTAHPTCGNCHPACGPRPGDQKRYRYCGFQPACEIPHHGIQ